MDMISIITLAAFLSGALGALVLSYVCKNKILINSEHRLPRIKQQRPWYESRFWGPFLIGLVGAFIAASALITSTLLTIHFGPNSLCDFRMEADPITDTINLNEVTTTKNISLKINVTDIHPLIKSYEHGVYVKVGGIIPNGTKVNLQNKAGKLPLYINATIDINKSECNPGEYEITFQGIGEDNIKRNLTYFLNIQYKDKEYRTYCSKDSDCPYDLICTDGICRYECETNSDCEDGQICHNGLCRSECETDSDCEDGQICHNGICRYECQNDSDCLDCLTFEEGKNPPGCVNDQDDTEIM